MGQSDLQFELAGSSRYPSSSYRGSTILLLFNTEIKSRLKIG